MRNPILATSIVGLLLGAPACGGESPPVFCDETEVGCTSTGGGSTDSTSPDFECNGKVCIYENVAGPCIAMWECVKLMPSDDEPRCNAVELKPGQDDKNACTEDYCDLDTGKWRHREFTAKDLDDGDPCTEDGCNEGFGPYHTNTCN